MKIAILGDTHLGRKLYGYDLTPNIRSIMYDFFRFCVASNVDYAIHLGDVGDRPQWPVQQQKQFVQWCNEFERAGIRLVVLAGNHDVISSKEATSTLDAVRAMTFNHVTIIDRPAVALFDGWQLLFLPFPSANLYETPQAWRDEVEGWVQELGDKVLTFCHLNVDGAVLGEQEWVYRGGEYAIPASVRAASEAVFCGHIHKGQTVGKGKGKVYIAGAAERLRFDEADKKRWLYVQEKRGGKLWAGATEIKATEIDTLEIDASGWTNSGDPPSTEEVIEALQTKAQLVKVQPFTDDQTTVDWHAVEDALNSMAGVEHVAMMPPIEVRRGDEEEEEREVTPEDVLEAARLFIRRRIKDKRERLALYGMFRTIVEEVEASDDR